MIANNNMNAIYNKLRPKRKYHKLPPCGHRNQICDMEHCRLAYAVKVPKNFPKIDEYLHHREKVIKRRREIELAKIDNINIITSDRIDYCCECKNMHGFVCPLDIPIKGEFSKHKELKAKYKRIAWIALFIFLTLVLLASLIM